VAEENGLLRTSCYRVWSLTPDSRVVTLDAFRGKFVEVFLQPRGGRSVREVGRVLHVASIEGGRAAAPAHAVVLGSRFSSEGEKERPLVVSLATIVAVRELPPHAVSVAA
jgi:hypothetical protein